MSAVAKEKTVEKTLEAKIAERKKEALEVVAPKILEIVTTLGMRVPTGFKYDADNCLFYYNELSGTITVTLGPNDQFAANPDKKVVTLYRSGSWDRILDVTYAKLEKSDKKEIKGRFESRFKDFFGL